MQLRRRSQNGYGYNVARRRLLFLCITVLPSTDAFSLPISENIVRKRGVQRRRGHSSSPLPPLHVVVVDSCAPQILSNTLGAGDATTQQMMNYAPVAASLFANMINPASILAAGIISIGLKKAPDPPKTIRNQPELLQHIENLTRTYITGECFSHFHASVNIRRHLPNNWNDLRNYHSHIDFLLFGIVGSDVGNCRRKPAHGTK